MKVLLATPEIEPLTGSTPLGQAAHRLARQLHASPDSDAIIAVPATEAMMNEFASDLTDTGAVISASSGGEGPSARVVEFRSSDEPQIYLLDSTELRNGFGDNLAPEILAGRALLWARFLANLGARLKPRIHIAHCFGWECGLLPPLCRARNLEFKTVLTTSPARGGGPPVAAVIEAVKRSGLSELTVAENVLPDIPLLAWAAGFADKANNLGSTGLQGDGGARDPLSKPSTAIRAKQRARASTLALHELKENALSTLFYIPTDHPAPLLPLLDRLLDADARVVLEWQPEDPAVETKLLATQLRHPGKFAFIKVESFLAEEQDWFTAADFLLLPPLDADNPASVAQVTLALNRGCTPIVPHRDHFKPVLPAPHAAEETAAVHYRNESPEGIWCALKRCMRLHRDPSRWKAQVNSAVRAGLGDEGVAPEFAELYREVIESTLAASPK